MTAASLPSTISRPAAAPNLVRHQVWKDLRKHRWVIAGWLGVLALATWIFGTQAGALAATGSVIGFCVDVLGILMAARLIFEDPLVGTTDAFWMTLPLRRSTLLLAKVILLVLVVLVPTMVAQLLSLWIAGVPAIQIVLALAGGFLWQAAMILTYAVLVTMVRGYLRYLGLAMLLTIGPLMALTFLMHDRGWNDPVLRLSGDRAPAALLLASAGALALLAARYFARWRRPAVWTWAGTVLLCAVFWIGAVEVGKSYDRDRAARTAPGAAVDGVFRRSVDLEPPVDAHAREGTGTRRKGSGAGVVVIPAGPAGYQLVPGRVQSRLRFADGRVSTFDWPGSSMMPRSDKLSPHDAVLGLPAPATRPGAERRPVPLTRPSSGGGGLPARDTEGVLTAIVTLDGFHYRHGPDLPLRAGAAADLGAWRVEVKHVTAATDSTGFVTVVQACRALFGGTPPEAPEPLKFAFSGAADGSVTALEDYGYPLGTRLITAWPYVVAREWRVLFDPAVAAREGLAGPDPPGLERARIRTSYATYVGSVDRRFTVENFNPNEW